MLKNAALKIYHLLPFFQPVTEIPDLTARIFSYLFISLLVYKNLAFNTAIKTKTTSWDLGLKSVFMNSAKSKEILTIFNKSSQWFQIVLIRILKNVDNVYYILRDINEPYSVLIRVSKKFSNSSRDVPSLHTLQTRLLQSWWVMSLKYCRKSRRLSKTSLDWSWWV